MRRLWLLATLLSLLLPVPAAAQSACVPPSSQRQYASAPAQDVGDQVRAGTGFELHTAREESRGGGLRSHGHPRATTGALTPLGPASAIRARTRPAPEGATPLCEHLPYHATAPPFRG